MSSAHSPTFPSLHLRHSSFSNVSVALPSHSSFSNPSVASPRSQFILQTFFHFSYITSSSLNSPGEPPMGRGSNSGPLDERHSVVHEILTINMEIAKLCYCPSSFHLSTPSEPVRGEQFASVINGINVSFIKWLRRIAKRTWGIADHR